MELFCFLCQQDFKSSGILKHLKACAIKNAGYASVKNDEDVCYLIHIRDRYDINYSLYLMVDGCVRLRELDEYLRNIWLECCGHLSLFDINGEYYESYTESSCENDMEEEVGNLFYPKLKLKYEYDFGSTTYLDIKVEGAFNSTDDKKGIRLLARNKAPEYKCHNCGQTADFYYVDYDDDLSGTVCSECRKEMKSEDYGIDFFELVNSPRMGVCAYYGPADDILFMPSVNKKRKGNEKKAKGKVINKDVYEDLDPFSNASSDDALKFLDELMSRDDYDEVKMQKLLADTFKKMTNFHRKDSPYILNKDALPEKTYTCCISLLKKLELDIIKRKLNIPGASSDRKAVLTKRIENYVHQNFREILEYMSYYDFEALEEVSSQSYFSIHYHDLNAITAIYPLLQRGLVFALKASNDEVELFFPLIKEFLKITAEPEFIKKREITKQIELKIQAVLFFWGAAEFEAIQSEVKKLIDITVSDEKFATDFSKVITNMTTDNLRTESIGNIKYYYMHSSCPYEQITSKTWQESSYPPLNKALLPKESTLEDFIMHIAYFRLLYELFYSVYEEEFVEELDEEDDELDEIDEELLHDEALETVIDIVKILLNEQTDLSAKELFDKLDLSEQFWEQKEFRDFFLTLKNQTPNYWMKGNTISGVIHTLDEGFEKAIQASKKADPVNSAAARWKTGRNDPCPCGSGKKYKNCCL